MCRRCIVGFTGTWHNSGGKFWWEGPQPPERHLLPPHVHDSQIADPPLPFDDRAGDKPKLNTGGGNPILSAQGNRTTAVFHQNHQPSALELTTMQGKWSAKSTHFDPINVTYLPTGTPTRVESPGHTMYDVGARFGNMYTVHDGTHGGLIQDEYGSNMPYPVQLFGRPFSAMRPKDLHRTVTITKARVEYFGGDRRKGWTPDQNTAMGGWSAKDAALKGGCLLTGEYHWLHLIAFSMGGINGVQPNVSKNLVVGTKESNAVHVIVESLAKKLAVRHGQVDIEFEIQNDYPYNLDLHLFRRFRYTIHNPNGGNSFFIDVDLYGKIGGAHGDEHYVRAYMEHLGFTF